MHARIRTDTYHVAEVQSLVETPALTGGSLARQTERFDGVFSQTRLAISPAFVNLRWPLGLQGKVGAAGWEKDRGGADMSHSASCGRWDPPAPLYKGGASPRERPPGQGKTN